jgi:hypothetical protein
VEVEAGEGCVADVDAQEVDDGSYDPEGGLITVEIWPGGPYPLGLTEVTLTVTCLDGNSDSCVAYVTVIDTVPPVVVCQDVTVVAGPTGFADADIDDGSYDACGGVTLVQSPPGPYPVGVHLVTLTAIDPSGNAASCQATVVVQVPVDIKPGSCPNPLFVNGRGVLPVAIVGSEVFDVYDIDVASIRLEGVAPIRSGYEDVTTPVDGDECECTTEAGDGITDLVLKFDKHAVAQALGEVVNGETLLLTLTGELLDGTSIEGADCIRVVKKPIK